MILNKNYYLFYFLLFKCIVVASYKLSVYFITYLMVKISFYFLFG